MWDEKALWEVYVCQMVFIFKLYRNKQGKKITLSGGDNVIAGLGGVI